MIIRVPGLMVKTRADKWGAPVFCGALQMATPLEPWRSAEPRRAAARGAVENQPRLAPGRVICDLISRLPCIPATRIART